MKSYGPLVLVVIATVALMPATLSLRVATGNEAWIDHQGPAWQALQRAEDRFGRADGFVIGIFAPDVLAPQMQRWLADLRGHIAVMDGIDGVHDLTNAEDVQIDGLGPTPVPLLPATPELLAPAQRNHVVNHPLYRHLLIDPSGNATAVLIDVRRNLHEDALQRLEIDLRRLLITIPPPAGTDTVLGGLPAQKQAINQAVVADQHLTVPLSITIHACLMMLILRSLILVAIPLASIATSLVWTYSGVALTGTPLDAVLGLLPPLVMGIAVSSALHLVYAFARQRLQSDQSTLRSALRQTALPLLLCVLTTMAGVLGLAWGPVTAVRNFAPYAAIGIALAAVTPVLWLWALSPWITENHCRKLMAGPFGVSLGERMNRLAAFCRRQAGGVVSMAVVIAAICALALTQVHADADFLHALPSDNPVRRAHERLDHELTGVLPLDLLIDLKRAPRVEDLSALTAIKQFMQDDHTVGSWLSLADVVTYVTERATSVGATVDPAQLLDDLSLGAPSVWKRFVGAGLDQPVTAQAPLTTLHIMIRQRDASVAGNAASARHAIALAQRSFPEASVMAASGCLLLDETSQRMIPATIRSTLLPLPCIAALLLVTMRSLRIALWAIPVAGLPLLITYAGLVPLGWPIDIGVSMIACIALGIIVDDAVRMSIAIGRETTDLPAAAASVGPVLVGGCLAMAGSFIACLAGQFAYTRHFGVLLAAAFLIALVVNATVTPALFFLTRPRQRTLEAP